MLGHKDPRHVCDGTNCMQKLKDVFSLLRSLRPYPTENTSPDIV
jgi:hypothetical protein